MANKATLVEAVRETGVVSTKKGAEEIVNVIFASIVDTLSEGEEVSIAGLGKFQVVQRAERAGRNPQTGEPITIPAKKAVKFKPAKALKDAVRGE